MWLSKHLATTPAVQCSQQSEWGFLLTPPSLTLSGIEGLLIMSPILHLELPSLPLVYFLLPMYSQSSHCACLACVGFASHTYTYTNMFVFNSSCQNLKQSCYEWFVLVQPVLYNSSYSLTDKLWAISSSCSKA